MIHCQLIDRIETDKIYYMYMYNEFKLKFAIYYLTLINYENVYI